MKSAVEELYTNIFEFFFRAYKWYQGGLGRHLLQSFTHPPKLHYEDVLADIEKCARNIDKLAQLGSQVEIHRKLAEVQSKLDLMLTIQGNTSSQVALLSSAMLNTDQRVMDLQFSDMITTLSKSNIGDAMESYQYNILSRRRRSQDVQRGFTNRFWLSPKLEQWTLAKESRLVFVQGNVQAKSTMREFSLCIIDQLRESKVPVLWALPGAEADLTAKTASAIDVLKNLILQAVRLSKQAPKESSMSRICTRFRTLSTEREWVQMLGSALRSVGPQCYITIDLSVLNGGLQSADKKFSWLRAFQELFTELAKGTPQVKVKVLLLLHRPRLQLEAAGSNRIPPDLLVPVRTHPIPHRLRKRMEAQLGGRNRVRAPTALPIRQRHPAAT